MTTPVNSHPLAMRFALLAWPFGPLFAFLGDALVRLLGRAISSAEMIDQVFALVSWPLLLALLMIVLLVPLLLLRRLLPDQLPFPAAALQRAARPWHGLAAAVSLVGVLVWPPALQTLPWWGWLLGLGLFYMYQDYRLPSICPAVESPAS